MPGRFARNSLFSTLAGLGTALGSLLSMVLVARILGVTATGQIAYMLWIVMLAVTFADFGIYQSLTRYLPELTAKDEGETAWRLAAYLLRPALVFAGLGAAAFVYRALTARADGPIAPNGWWLIGLLFMLQLISSFGLGLLRGMQHFDAAAKLTLASLVLQALAVFAGALLAGVDGALLGYCFGNMLPIIVIARLVGRSPLISRELRARVIKFALFSWAGALTLTLVWSRLELFFLQRYLGSEAVALFTVGLTLANLASQGPLLLTGGLLAHFSENYGRHNIERMQDAYSTATRVMAFILFPTCLGLAAVVPLLLPMVFGPNFAPAVPAASVLAAGAAIGAAGSVGSQMIYAHERSDFIFASGLVGAALSVAAGFLIIPVYGLMGAALARVAIHGIMFALGSWFIMRRLSLRLPAAALAKLLLSALICALAGYLCTVSLANPLMALPAAVVAGTIAYMASVRALGALPSHDIARLRGLTVRLPGIARGPMASLFTFLAPRGA